MRRQQWVWLPIQLGVLCVAVGFVVILLLFLGAGEQVTSATQLPFVLVAGGVGLGLVLFGVALLKAQRQRLDEQRLEDAAARMLLAAARLSSVSRGPAGSSGTVGNPAFEA